MAVHVITEVGKPGRAERERRHFRGRHSEAEEYTRGRLYLCPNEGMQPEWKPHAKSIQVEYVERGGLDWISKIKYIPDPKELDPRLEVTLPKRRYFPGKRDQTSMEWSLHPEGLRVGRRCRVSTEKDMKTKEITHSMLYGEKRKIYTELERRGGYPSAALGDKSYQAAEFSTGFHSFGSTRPVVNFGGSTSRPDTFVPLQTLPTIPCKSYRSKERRRIHSSEIETVTRLDEWRPAAPLIPFLMLGYNRTLLLST